MFDPGSLMIDFEKGRIIASPKIDLNTNIILNNTFEVNSNILCFLHHEERRKVLVSQLYMTLGHHSLSDSSVHGILQAITLEWVAIPSSRGPL